MKSNNKICILLILIVIIILILYFYLNLGYNKNLKKNTHTDIKINDKFENLDQNTVNLLGNNLVNASNFYNPTVRCKYIKIERIYPAPVPGPNPYITESYMNIARIYIYDDRGNQLPSSVLTPFLAPEFPYRNGPYPASKLIDYTNSDGFAHTNIRTIFSPVPYFRIDLNNETSISRIDILNRQEQQKHRMVGTKLTVYDANNNLVYIKMINTIEDRYSISMPNGMNSQVSNIIKNVNQTAELQNLLSKSTLNQTNISNNLIDAKKNLTDSIKNMAATYKNVKDTLNGYVIKADIPEPELNPSATLDPSTIITETAETEPPESDIEDVDVNSDMFPPVYVYDIDSAFESSAQSSVQPSSQPSVDQFNNVNKASSRDKNLDKFANYKPLNINSFEPFEDWRQDWNKKIYQTGLVVEPESKPNGPVTVENIPLLVRYGPYPTPIAEVNNKIVSDLLAFNVRNSTNKLLNKWKKNYNK